MQRILSNYTIEQR